MVSIITFSLAVLSSICVGAAIGSMVGGMNRAAKAHHEAFGEHKFDAQYPRVGD
ncbi:hypothetical protein [Paraburkholderia sp. DGU8]|uniref:hypothetical protein n=1 Tax=Paraburkholderia sp. DGU8 TaxID=3161997 RepID=UPI003466D796